MKHKKPNPNKYHVGSPAFHLDIIKQWEKLKQ